MKVYKRNGQEVDFCLDKIKSAIDKANVSTFVKFKNEIASALYDQEQSEGYAQCSYNELMKMTDDNADWSSDDLKPSIGKLDPSKKFTRESLTKAVSKWVLVDGAFNKVVETSQKFLKPFDSVTVEDISDLVEKALMKHNAYEVAKEYILYRDNKRKNKKFTDTEEKILAVIDGTNDELRGDNANKRIDVNSAARDYIAGTECKEIAKKILPKDVIAAHNKKWIHFHDMDYSPVMHETNCCVYDLEDILDNGFCMNDVGIKSPKRFSTGGNLAAQTNLVTSSLQYGGQTFTWTALAKYVDKSRKDIAITLKNFLLEPVA